MAQDNDGLNPTPPERGAAQKEYFRMTGAMKAGPPPGEISIIDAAGVQRVASAADLGERISAGRLFWLDISFAAPLATNSAYSASTSLTTKRYAGRSTG